MAAYLDKIAYGEVDRLMIFCPPGSAKSTYGSVFMPAAYMGRFPTRSIIGASHSLDLAEKFGRRTRNLMLSAEYQEIYDTRLSEDSQAAGKWDTDKGGEFYAVGVGGGISGHRADLAIIDDPVKSKREADSPLEREKLWEWYLNDLLGRLKPNGAIVLIMTRWHEDDLAGRLLKADPDHWTVVSLPAIAEENDILGREEGEALWPEWQSLEQLERRKAEVTVEDMRAWSALYQQRPQPESGEYFRRDWLRWYDTRPEHLKIYGASDYAVTKDGGDWTVHLVVGVDPVDNIYVLDMWRGRTASDVWVETALDLMEKWSPHAWIEESAQIEKAVGPFIEKRQRERRVYTYRRQVSSAADKSAKARAIQARTAMGKLYLPVNQPWADGLLEEMLRFPTGVNDDQVDTLSLIGRHLADLATPRVPKQPVDIYHQLNNPVPLTMNELWKLHDAGKGTGAKRL